MVSILYKPGHYDLLESDPKVTYDYVFQPKEESMKSMSPSKKSVTPSKKSSTYSKGKKSIITTCCNKYVEVYDYLESGIKKKSEGYIRCNKCDKKYKEKELTILLSQTECDFMSKKSSKRK